MPKALKVIQWGTGNIGAKALSAVIAHPLLELAGLWVHSADKVGKDAAQLCEVDEKTGILATNSVSDLVGTVADCVLYLRQGTDMDELCRLLASGKNVVTTRGDFHFPPALDPADRKAIEEACRVGGTTVYSTGSSPGFVTEALPLPLLSLSRRLDCLTIDEFADLSTRNSPELLFSIMGFGRTDGKIGEGQIEHVKGDFAGTLAQLADSVGIAIDEWVAKAEISRASENVTIVAGPIEKGSVAAQRIAIIGMTDGRPRFRFRANWYATDRIIDADWELRASGWRVRVEGDTPLDVSIRFPVAPEDYAAFTPGLTAHRAVNAVHAVCDAPPGIATTSSLCQVIPNLG